MHQVHPYHQPCASSSLLTRWQKPMASETEFEDLPPCLLLAGLPLAVSSGRVEHPLPHSDFLSYPQRSSFPSRKAAKWIQKQLTFQRMWYILSPNNENKHFSLLHLLLPPAPGNETSTSEEWWNKNNESQCQPAVHGKDLITPLLLEKTVTWGWELGDEVAPISIKSAGNGESNFPG